MMKYKVFGDVFNSFDTHQGHANRNFLFKYAEQVNQTPLTTTGNSPYPWSPDEYAIGSKRDRFMGTTPS